MKPVVVVAGKRLGVGGGTGGASARAFAKEGYSVALIARNADALKAFEDELKGSGLDVASFPVTSYASSDVADAFTQIRARFSKPSYTIRAAIFNVVHRVFKPFLEVTPEEVKAVIETNIGAGFAFSREAILDLLENPIDPATGARGVLIHTGAGSGTRGGVFNSAFSTGKHVLRALSQSLAKEFGKENIHVVHAIIDGPILTPTAKSIRNDPEWEKDEAVRLNPESIAAAGLFAARFDAISVLILRL
ncbi:hypothetical protein V5O48_014316 [Marasmius crinis-equi]|uniref:Uncharacterized protein n=1 Tax=Marasmius crinis-equi TaxID=585013 RepID=A0ABR3EXQ4_9AGAR